MPRRSKGAGSRRRISIAERDPDPIALPDAAARHEAIQSRPFVQNTGEPAQYQMEQCETALRWPTLVVLVHEAKRIFHVHILGEVHK
jgi:hypothetical protein